MDIKDGDQLIQAKLSNGDDTIIMATKEDPNTSKIVVRMQGTNFEEGRKILQNSKLKVNFVETLDEATTVIKHLSKEDA